MSGDKTRDIGTDECKRRLGGYWLAIFVVAPAIILGALAWRSILLHLRPVDVQLAAIEAARAIPESEDAGVAYIRLAENHLPLPPNPPVVDAQALSLTVKRPWLSQDYPKLVAWLDERRDLMSKLIEISKMEKCRLPIPPRLWTNRSYSDPARQMTGWNFLLIRSANNDVAQGRIDAAIEKYTCILRMAAHLYQQPHLRGTSHEGIVLHVLKDFITDNELTERQLEAIEAALLPPENRWKQDSKIKDKVRRLLERKERPSLTDWRNYWAYRKRTRERDKDSLERTHDSYLWTLSERRSTYILIALRRFKNEHGHWPQNLDLVEPQLSKEVLVDPRTQVPFVCEVDGENFKLYRTK